MSDLFNQPKNFPREKVQGRGVAWAYMLFPQIEKAGLSQEVINHINSMDPEKASGYAKYLVQDCGFPVHFFNDCPQVVLKFEK